MTANQGVERAVLQGDLDPSDPRFISVSTGYGYRAVKLRPPARTRVRLCGAPGERNSLHSNASGDLLLIRPVDRLCQHLAGQVIQAIRP